MYLRSKLFVLICFHLINFCQPIYSFRPPLGESDLVTQYGDSRIKQSSSHCLTIKEDSDFRFFCFLTQKTSDGGKNAFRMN